MNKMIKRKLTRAAAVSLVCVTVLGSTVYPVAAEEANFAKTYVSLGADLDADQRAFVLTLLDLTEEDLQNCTVMQVTNDMEHQYLDAYLTADIIGDQAWSSAKITGKNDGYGIKVTTKNITYCTASMYENALATAGVKNADIQVAGPAPISGTAALIGVMQSYSAMSGEQIADENVDAATDELVVTSELGEGLADQEQASTLIAAVKDAVAEEDISSSEDIDKIIDDAADQMDLSLTDEQKEKIRSLMEKISELDLDADNLKEQAQSVYEKLESLDLDLSQEKVQGFFAKIGSFFGGIWDKLVEWFNNLFD